MSTIQTSLNPSDYEFILKSAVEGNLTTRAQSLKRLNSLILNDKKQFAIYAKRVVLIIQDLLLEPKEDINLLASTLTLEIINLNPRQIQYYIRTKLLKSVVRNLGDSKPQIRKTSHYCLLAYVKTYKTFDQIIQVYLTYGITSQTWQLRQKSINSFQSILIMEIKYLNWSSAQFRRVVEELLSKTKDQSQFVQKAAQQCLISICKFEDVRNFSRKLPTNTFNELKSFCQQMFSQGLLHQIKLYTYQTPSLLKSTSTMHMPPQSLQPLTISQAQRPKVEPDTPQMSQRQTLLGKIEEIRKKTQTPMKEKKLQSQQKQEQTLMRKAESVHLVPKKAPVDLVLPTLRKSINIQETEKFQMPKVMLAKTQKNDGLAMGRKIMEDLKNDKDWKVRLEAIEQLQSKFNAARQTNEVQTIAKTYLPVLIKLLGDPNFKVALISLKLIEDILLLQSTNYTQIIPQLAERINDGKIALRQNVSKLIRTQFSRTGNKLWIIELLNQLKKSANSNIKEEILNIFTKIIMDNQSQEGEAINRMSTIEDAIQPIIQAIYPLMDDLKTKIKIKTLDLLILISVKTCKIEQIKNILALKLNQIYFQMYLQKISKQMKNVNNNSNISPERISATTNLKQKNEKLLINQRYNKSNGNSTSSSLRRVYSSIDEHNNTVRTSSFIDKKRGIYETPAQKEEEEETTSLRPSNQLQQQYKSQKKSNILKSHRKKTFDYKSTQFSSFSCGSAPGLEPFNDPEKQLKNLLSEIKQEDWQACTEALTKLRRIVENHSQLLTQPIVKIIVPQVMRLVESLRSNLSKNAVITLNDLSNKMKKGLDTELDSIFTKLLKKTLDTNSFISEEVRRALISICSNGNESKVLNLLMNARSSRAIPIKISIMSILQSVSFLPKFYEKQIQRIVTILVDFLDEGSLEIRERTKALLSNIINSQKGEPLLKMVPSHHVNKIKLKQKQKVVHQAKPAPSQDAGQDSRTEEGKIKRKKKQKITVFPAQFDQLQSLLQQCQSGDWKNREKNMTTINETVIIPYPKEFAEHKLSGKIMDILSKQIGDPNTKVATNALRILHQLPTRIPQIIQHNLSVLINQIFNCFASHKPEIKTLSQSLFNQICESIEKWMLIQHLSNGVLYGLQKSRAAILTKLNQILPSVYAKGNKKIIISKSVYPLINKLAEQNKVENSEGLIALMRTCQEQTNGQFVTFLKPKAIQIYNTELAE